MEECQLWVRGKGGVTNVGDRVGGVATLSERVGRGGNCKREGS